MVDVGGKPVTHRVARAQAVISAPAAVLSQFKGGDIRGKKGPVFHTAIIAGVMAAKKTSELIPLCHPLALSKAQVEFAPSDTPPGIHIRAEVKVNGPTGVEMEALTAVSVAALTIYDMLKAADRAMRIDGIRLLEKSGGRSGTYKAEPAPKPGA
jgi:cyclic pyranopterin phosphate synthase